MSTDDICELADIIFSAQAITFQRQSVIIRGKLTLLRQPMLNLLPLVVSSKHQCLLKMGRHQVIDLYNARSWRFGSSLPFKLILPQCLH